MCLDRLIRVHGFPNEGVGYKGIDLVDEKSFSTLFGQYGSPLNEWLTANTSTKIMCLDCSHYLSGFHIYTFREAAKDYQRISTAPFVLATVEYKDLMYVGEEKNKAVLIAKQMRVSLPTVERVDTINCYSEKPPMEYVKGVWYYSPQWRTSAQRKKGHIPAVFDRRSSEILFPK